MSTIKACGLEVDAAALLAELHNGTTAQGMGVLHDRGPMTWDEAAQILADHPFCFDYLRGRPLKIMARDGVLLPRDFRQYDEIAGIGAGETAVLRASEYVTSETKAEEGCGRGRV